MVRRKDDRNIHYYVDLYGTSLIVTFVIALILSIADAFLTLKLVGMGAQELNPVMNFVLKYGPMPFLLIKYVLTAFGLTALLVLNNYHFLGGKIMVRTIFLTIPLLYALLIGYEMFLISSIERI